MKKENKNKLISSFLILGSLATIIYFVHSKVHESDHESEIQNKTVLKESIPNQKVLKKENIDKQIDKEKKITRIKKERPISRRPSSLLIGTNKVSDDWKEKLMTNLTDSISDEIKVEILESTPHVYKYHHSVTNTQKVKIQVTRNDGLKSTYMAMVNATSGSIMRTWAKTRYEYPDKVFPKIPATALIED